MRSVFNSSLDTFNTRILSFSPVSVFRDEPLKTAPASFQALELGRVHDRGHLTTQECIDFVQTNLKRLIDPGRSVGHTLRHFIDKRPDVSAERLLLMIVANSRCGNDLLDETDLGLLSGLRFVLLSFRLVCHESPPPFSSASPFPAPSDSSPPSSSESLERVSSSSMICRNHVAIFSFVAARA